MASTAQATSDIHAEVAGLFEKFSLVKKIEEINALKDAELFNEVSAQLKVDADATVELVDAFECESAPKSLSKGDTESFKIRQGNVLNYKVTCGDVTGNFKITFDVDDDAPKLKPSGPLEDGDGSGIGIETTKVETETEIQLSKKVEIKTKWTKGKRPEKKAEREVEHEGKALGLEFEFTEESKVKQEKDEFESEVETKSEIERKTVEVFWRIY